MKTFLAVFCAIIAAVVVIGLVVGVAVSVNESSAHQERLRRTLDEIRWHDEAEADAQRIVEGKPSLLLPHATIAVASSIQASPAPTPNDAFKRDVVYSQQAAITKHPELSTMGSALNKRFLARLSDWKARQDPRLRKSNWPEALADDCAVRP